MTTKRLLVDGLDKNTMGLVTSPDGDSHIILNSKSQHSPVCNISVIILLTQQTSSTSSTSTEEQEVLLIVPCLWWSSCMSDEVT